MAHVQYKGSDAIKEHLLAGHEISVIEAVLIFGVQNSSELTRLRKTGFVVQKRRVPMAKILRRANQFWKSSSIKPPNPGNSCHGILAFECLTDACSANVRKKF